MDFVSKYLDIKNIPYRKWVFTCNNPTDEKISKIQQFGENECMYLRYQWEKAPKTGTIHLQGFFISREPQYTVKNYSSKKVVLQDKLPGCRFEVMKASIAQNYRYCKKYNSRLDIPGWSYKQPGLSLRDYIWWEENPWDWCYGLYKYHNMESDSNFMCYWETIKQNSDIILDEYALFI